MIINPQVKEIVQVTSISKSWDSSLLKKIGLIRQVYQFTDCIVIGVEFLDWGKGHKLLFDLLDSDNGWFFMSKHLEYAKL